MPSSTITPPSAASTVQSNFALATDAVSGESNAIGRVRRSVGLFPLYPVNKLTFGLNFCMCTNHDHRSPGTETEGHRTRSGSGLAR